MQKKRWCHISLSLSPSATNSLFFFLKYVLQSKNVQLINKIVLGHIYNITPAPTKVKQQNKPPPKATILSFRSSDFSPTLLDDTLCSHVTLKRITPYFSSGINRGDTQYAVYLGKVFKNVCCIKRKSHTLGHTAIGKQSTFQQHDDRRSEPRWLFSSSRTASHVFFLPNRVMTRCRSSSWDNKYKRAVCHLEKLLLLLLPRKRRDNI